MKKKNNLFTIVIIVFIGIIGVLIANNIINKPGELKKITYNEIKEKLDNKEDFILIVSRSTCSHCTSYKPKVEQVAKNYKITVYYIDYDEEKKDNQKKLLETLHLDGSTPMTLFINNGKETSILRRLEGDVEKDKIIERLKELQFIK